MQPDPIFESEYNSVRTFYRLAELRTQRLEILSRSKNDQKIEQDFRRISSLYQNQISDTLINQSYQEYANSYHQIVSLYLIGEVNKKISLFIYDTESEREEVKMIKFPWKLDKWTCITQLPNGELFCNYEEDSETFKVFIIDRNYEVRILPSETQSKFSSAIYFNRSVYCFGGSNDEYLNISSRFDLELNQWFQLASMDDQWYFCSSTLFKGNILLSEFSHENLILYSIEIDSISILPYEFSSHEWKILMSTDERLYLIDCKIGVIYESEDQFSWQQIATSNIRCNCRQVYCTYNKGGIYISTIDQDSIREYYKFDLSKITLDEIDYYDKHVALKKLDDKFEAVECLDQTFTLDSDHALAYFNKGYSLYELGKKLEHLECFNEEIKNNPNSAVLYIYKGSALEELERYIEAIECYNKSIMIEPYLNTAYLNKGRILSILGRSTEAIEIYNEAIKLFPTDPGAYFYKGLAFHDLRRYNEALECYNEVIDLKAWDANVSYNKGLALYELDRNLEAIECYNEVLKIHPRDSDVYFDKGNALYCLERNDEAVESYNDAIKLNPNLFAAHFNKGNALYDLGKYLEAIESYNEAIKLNPNWASSYFYKGNALDELGREAEAIECYNEVIKIDWENSFNQ